MGKALVAALVVGLLGGVPQGYAEEPAPPQARIRWGYVEVHPAATLSGVFDDNIFKVNSSATPGLEPTQDIYLTLNPRLGLRLPYQRGFFAAGYGWQAVKYANAFDDAVDTTIWDTYNTHNAFAEASLKFGRGLGLGLRDDLQRRNLFITSVDIATVSPTGKEELKPIGLLHNELKPTVVYSFTDSNLQLDAGYNLGSDRFSQRRFQYLDKDQHVPRGKVSYRFFPKTAAFLEGEGYFVRYQRAADAASFALLNKRDADGWKGWIGAQGAITSRLSTILAGGWGQLDYASFSGFPAGQNENANTWLAKFEMNEKFSERTKVTLGVARDFFDSYSTNFYVSNRAYLELWRSLTPSIAAVVGGNYFRNDYSRPFSRFDEGFLASAKLEIRPLSQEWLKLNTGYNREQRSSSLKWYRYHTNQVFAEIAAEL